MGSLSDDALSARAAGAMRYGGGVEPAPILP
jgi:hypothetical protein